MSTSSMRSSQRSSISPFRSRKASSSAAAPGKPAGRPTTPSSSSLSSSARPTTPSSLSGRPTTPLSVSRQPNPGRPSPISPTTPSTSDRSEFSKSKENVTVTVRFRPLSAREINKGDEIAWYADGDYTVRNEYNASVAYSFDRVFGPATTTRHVYDVAAQHVVGGAMQGINGTVFAYGVTSSGKTHTMHEEVGCSGIVASMGCGRLKGRVAYSLRGAEWHRELLATRRDQNEGCCTALWIKITVIRSHLESSPWQ